MVNFPRNLVAGETLTAKLSHPTATAVSVIFVGPGKHTLPFTQAESECSLTQATDAWAAGVYAWQLWVTNAGGKSLCGSGRMIVAASLENLEAGADTRTVAERNIEALEAMIGGTANLTTKRYRINNRELEKYSISELITLLEYWKKQRRAERPRRQGPHIRVKL